MTESYCEEHSTEWFKRGKMRAYAHPIKDAEDNTLGWCPMIKPKPKSVSEAPPTARVGASATGANAPAGLLRSQPVMLDNRNASIEAQVGLKELGEWFRSEKAMPVLWKMAYLNCLASRLKPWVNIPLAATEVGSDGPAAVMPAKPVPAVTDLSITPIPVPREFVMCPIHKMPLNKKTKDGTPAHEFTDAQGARHKCIPKIDPALCVKHNVPMRQDAQGNYYHAVDEDSVNPEICKGR